MLAFQVAHDGAYSRHDVTSHDLLAAVIPRLTDLETCCGGTFWLMPLCFGGNFSNPIGALSYCDWLFLQNSELLGTDMTKGCRHDISAGLLGLRFANLSPTYLAIPSCTAACGPISICGPLSGSACCATYQQQHLPLLPQTSIYLPRQLQAHHQTCV